MQMQDECLLLPAGIWCARTSTSILRAPNDTAACCWLCAHAGAASALQQLASCCSLLRQLPKAAAASSAAALSLQLVGCIQQVLALLKDVWCVLRLLGGADSQADMAVAAAAAAECGCSLLAGLVAVSAAVDGEDSSAGALKGELTEGYAKLVTGVIVLQQEGSEV
jgi:hypothetical protein